MRVTTILAALLLLARAAHAQSASYGPYPEETYLASGDPTSTTAVAVMHGGWDVGGGDNTVEVKRICAALALRHVYVVSFNYRLATPGAHQSWPAQWQDAQLMMRFLRSKGYARVGIVGLSAGAYNALGVAFKGSTIYWAATDPKREAMVYAGRSGPDFAVALSPFSNLNDPKLAPLAVRRLTEGIAPGYALISQTIKNSMASPISMLRGDTAPILVIHGSNDPVVPIEQSQTLAAEMSYIQGNFKFVQTTGRHVLGGYDAAGLAQLYQLIGDCVVGAAGSVCAPQ
jgi:acetyl esterase/lipase